MRRVSVLAGLLCVSMAIADAPVRAHDFELFEQVSWTLDHALNEARLAQSVLLVVARPAAIERTPRMSDFRLKVIRAYFESTNRDNIQVFFAVGDKTDKSAVIEFYVSGKALIIKGEPVLIHAPKWGFVNPWTESEDGYYFLKPTNLDRFLKLRSRRKTIMSCVRHDAQQARATERAPLRLTNSSTDVARAR